MAYSPFADDRRSRRRRNLILFGAVAILVAIVALAVRYRTEERETVDYLDLAEEVAGEHETLSATLSDLFASLDQLDRPTVLQRLTTLSEDAAGLEKRIDEAVVPRPVAGAHGSLLVAVSAWSDGLDAFDEAIVQVLDAPDGDSSGEVVLDDVFDLLRLGDRAYADFREAVDRLEADLVTIELPAIAYAGTLEAPIYDAVSLSEELRRLRLLSEDRDVAVSLKVDPEPASVSGGVAVVPFSEDFVVTAVISNDGNVSIEQISVVMTLSRTSSSEEPFVESRAFPALSPGESTSLEFSDLRVEEGAIYSLVVEVSLAEPDVNVDNNSVSLMFQRNTQ